MALIYSISSVYEYVESVGTLSARLFRLGSNVLYTWESKVVTEWQRNEFIGPLQYSIRTFQRLPRTLLV